MRHTIFGPGARNADPTTSHLAAQRAPQARDSDRHKALLLHAANPQGLTDFELAVLMNRQQTSAGKRRGELRDIGLICDSSFRRRAPSGSMAIVWCITFQGRALVRQQSPLPRRPLTARQQ